MLFNINAIFTAMGAQRESSGKQQQQKESSSPPVGSGNAIDGAGSGHPRGGGPYFDKVASKNVTALLGKTAYLNCRVKNLGNKTVRTHVILYPFKL